MSSDFFFSGPCSTATYQKKENGNVQVKNRGWFWWFFFSYYSLLGEANCNTDGKCWVAFRQGEGNETKQEGKANYNILYTDYTNYALVYNCEDTALGKDEDAWILTRDWNISEAQVSAYEAEFKRLMPTFGGKITKHE